MKNPKTKEKDAVRIRNSTIPFVTRFVNNLMFQWEEDLAYQIFYIL